MSCLGRAMSEIRNTQQKVDQEKYGENHDRIFKKCGRCAHFRSYADIYEDPEEDFEMGLCNQDGKYLSQEQVSIDDGCVIGFERRLKPGE
jgi:hypothetical protein